MPPASLCRFLVGKGMRERVAFEDAGGRGAHGEKDLADGAGHFVFASFSM